ncbi:hypothetical protein EYF80_042748 [Liparis tanakae]|uniref:Uncharacterized protein n=1 Tax=Liparis tanakae TaxID=230148 RepID=A0A4Z2G2J5_9TELE|nr:hypothetical protein EYF80_042748 [Liparis tanakae]
MNSPVVRPAATAQERDEETLESCRSAGVWTPLTREERRSRGLREEVQSPGLGGGLDPSADLVSGLGRRPPFRPLKASEGLTSDWTRTRTRTRTQTRTSSLPHRKSARPRLRHEAGEPGQEVSAYPCMACSAWGS